MWFSCDSDCHRNRQSGLMRHQHRNGDACWMRCLLFGGILMQLIANSGCGAGALRSVSLIVNPSVARRGQAVTFHCKYHLLHSAQLYSVKFYRGEREFYRYTPNDIDSRQKVFPFPGILVDKHNSDDDQVLIKNVGFGLAGNFSCEVSLDAPTFSTAMAHTNLQVVELPVNRPMLHTEQRHYEVGEVLRAQCNSTAARPRVELVITLNNLVIYNVERTDIQKSDGTTVSSAAIEVDLKNGHFGHSGQLLLRCTAQVGHYYQEYTELELGILQRDPVPARVTSSSIRSNLNGYFQLMFLTKLAISLSCYANYRYR